MAQKITSTTIAIGVSFHREKTTWQRGELRYVGIADDLLPPDPPVMFLGTDIPMRMLGKRLVDSSPVFGLTCPGAKETFYTIPKGHFGLKDVDPPTAQDALQTSPEDVLVSIGPAGKSSIVGDPWQMRDDFLRMPRSVDKLLMFLKEWGSPLGYGQFLYPFDDRIPARLGVDDRAPLPTMVQPADVWRLQDKYRVALKGTPEEWLREKAPIGLITHQSEFPYLVAKASDIRTAIEMTITIDMLNTVPFQKCVRPDCYVPFEVRPGKDYCSQYCGHLESVRRNRAEDRKRKLAATHKKSKARKKAKA